MEEHALLERLLGAAWPTGQNRNLPEQIKAVRALLRMDQKEFAGALGVTQSAVSAWELGKYPPSGELLLKLGNLADLPRAIFFWTRAGIDLAWMLSAVGFILSRHGVAPTADQIAKVPELLPRWRSPIAAYLDAARMLPSAPNNELLRLSPAEIERRIAKGEIRGRRLVPGNVYLLECDLGFAATPQKSAASVGHERKSRRKKK